MCVDIVSFIVYKHKFKFKYPLVYNLFLVLSSLGLLLLGFSFCFYSHKCLAYFTSIIIQILGGFFVNTMTNPRPNSQQGGGEPIGGGGVVYLRRHNKLTCPFTDIFYPLAKGARRIIKHNKLTCPFYCFFPTL